jgi:hypothetical protein
MSYASADHAAAVGDLLEFDSSLIEIDGRKFKAHIERGEITQDASEVGLDNREETLNATIVNNGFIPKFSAPVLYRGNAYRIQGITPEGERVLTLNLTND